MNPPTTMIVASTVASALVGGVFFAFSVFVMRALSILPPARGIVAMQRVNITVINPLFLGVFLGTAPLLGVTAYLGRQAPQSFARLLASLEATSAEAAAYWPVYMREWLTWNHVRCFASLGAAVIAMLAGTP